MLARQGSCSGSQSRCVQDCLALGVIFAATDSVAVLQVGMHVLMSTAMHATFCHRCMLLHCALRVQLMACYVQLSLQQAPQRRQHLEC